MTIYTLSEAIKNDQFPIGTIFKPIDSQYSAFKRIDTTTVKIVDDTGKPIDDRSYPISMIIQTMEGTIEQLPTPKRDNDTIATKEDIISYLKYQFGGVHSEDAIYDRSEIIQACLHWFQYGKDANH